MSPFLEGTVKIDILKTGQNCLEAAAPNQTGAQRQRPVWKRRNSLSGIEPRRKAGIRAIQGISELDCGYNLDISHVLRP